MDNGVGGVQDQGVAVERPVHHVLAHPLHNHTRTSAAQWSERPPPSRL